LLQRLLIYIKIVCQTRLQGAFIKFKKDHATFLKQKSVHSLKRAFLLNTLALNEIKLSEKEKLYKKLFTDATFSHH